MENPQEDATERDTHSARSPSRRAPWVIPDWICPKITSDCLRPRRGPSIAVEIGCFACPVTQHTGGAQATTRKPYCRAAPRKCQDSWKLGYCGTMRVRR